MIIGHMPGGFLIVYLLLRKHRTLPYYLLLIAAGLFASIAPDLDLFYHHFIDNRQHGHHSYWTHIPIFWLGIYLCLFIPARIWCGRKIQLLLHVMFFGLMSHMLLDSVTSGIKWLYPFDDQYYGLWRLWIVRAKYDWWILNYVLHWTFIYELTLLIASICIIWCDRALRLSSLQLIKNDVLKRLLFRPQTNNVGETE